MALKNTAEQYGSLSKFFHWTVAIMVVALLTVGFIMDDISDKALKMQVYNIHKLIGLSVLLLMIMRLLWRLNNVLPEYPPTVPKWARKAARATHDLLYLVLIIMPLSGWIMSSAAGHPPHLGSWSLGIPGLTANKTLAQYGNSLHYVLAWAIPSLILLHIGAALKHHFMDKDEVLLRMLPWAKLKK